MRKRQISKYILILLIIICLIMLGVLIYIKFFSSPENKEYALLKRKAEGELVYLDSTLVELLNKLNNISYYRYNTTIEQINESQQQPSSESTSGGSESETDSGGGKDESKASSSTLGNSSEVSNQSEARTSRLSPTNSLLNTTYDEIPWNEISYGVENLYAAWPTINIDMKTLNVQEEDLINFSVTLDGAAQAIKAEDKNNTLINLYNLYTLLPKFLSYFSNDEERLNLYYTKAYVLNAYISASRENWAEMNGNINQALKSLSSIMNTADSSKTNYEKSYVLLQDLQRGTSLEDKEIFYLKYKLAIEELEML